MPDFTVVKFGTDTSGRGLYATRYMLNWWHAVCDRLGFTPTVTQGAFMIRNGGGAAASAGYHDHGGCFDLRVWDRTPDEVRRIITITRQMGAGSWVRDAQRGGMDPHIHLVLGTDRPLAPGAAWQWSEYVEGNDGLAGRGSDYHPRPHPLVLTPPPLEDIMASIEDLRKVVREEVAPVAQQAKKNGALTYNRDQKILAAVAALGEAVEALADTSAKKGQVAKVRGDIQRLRDELTEDGDASPRS